MNRNANGGENVHSCWQIDRGSMAFVATSTNRTAWHGRQQFFDCLQALSQDMQDEEPLKLLQCIFGKAKWAVHGRKGKGREAIELESILQHCGTKMAATATYRSWNDESSKEEPQGICMQTHDSVRMITAAESPCPLTWRCSKALSYSL
jgi:hypothetical protein